MPRGEKRLRTQSGKLNQIGSRVKARREDVGLTANDLCARLDMFTEGRWRPTREHIYKLESEVRLVSDLELMALSECLGVDPAWLLVGEIRSIRAPKRRSLPGVVKAQED
jgi:transcriptional regulator with XRE-family HTH domain